MIFHFESQRSSPLNNVEMIIMFSIFQVLDVEEEQASPTTSIELDVIVENNSSFKSLWPSFYINILTLSLVTRQGSTCPFFLRTLLFGNGGKVAYFSRTRGRASISVSVLIPILLVVTTTTIPTFFLMMIITLLARKAARSLCKQ